VQTIPVSHVPKFQTREHNEEPARLASGIYNSIYIRFCGLRNGGRIFLILLVGAGRFERPTSCAQGRFRQAAQMGCFQYLLFQAVAGNLLKMVERFGTRKLWHPHFYLQS